MGGGVGICQSFDGGPGFGGFRMFDGGELFDAEGRFRERD
jgi:hypothetical protein